VEEIDEDAEKLEDRKENRYTENDQEDKAAHLS
jgi:hypothetical protein